jgi:hypothetical protein
MKHLCARWTAIACFLACWCFVGSVAHGQPAERSPAPSAVAAKFELPETLPDSDPRKQAYLASFAEMGHRYPDSIVPGSALHERIIRMNQRCTATQDPMAISPNKPMLMAEVCVAQMQQEAAAIAPVPQQGPAVPPAAKPGPRVPKGAPALSPQDRIDDVEDALRREDLQRDLDQFHRHMKDYHDQVERNNRLPPVKPPAPMPPLTPIAPIAPIAPLPGGAGR